MGVKGLWGILNTAVEDVYGGEELSSFLDGRVGIVDLSRWLMEANFSMPFGYGTPTTTRSSTTPAASFTDGSYGPSLDFLLLTVYRKTKQLLLLGARTIIDVLDSLRIPEGKKRAGGGLGKFRARNSPGSWCLPTLQPGPQLPTGEENKFVYGPTPRRGI